MNKKTNWEESKTAWNKASLLHRIVGILFFVLGTPLAIYVMFIASDSPFQKIYTIISSKNSNTNLSSNELANNNGNNREHIEIVLTKKENSPQLCHMYYEIKNKTQINFSSMQIEMVNRDSTDNIVNKDSFRIRVTPNGSAVADHIAQECSSISKIEIIGFGWLTEVNGESPKGSLKNEINELPIQSESRVATVTIKSNGGEISHQANDNGNNAVANEVPPNNSVINTESCMRNCGDPNTSCVSLSMSAEQDCRLAIQACQLKCMPQ